MAIDLKLKHTCPHRTQGEWIALDQDRKTLRPLRNPASKNLVLKRNGVEVPNEGIIAPAIATGNLQEPFRVMANSSLAVKVGSTPTQVLSLTAGARRRANDIVNEINALAQGFKAVNSKGRIQLETLEAGRDQTLFLQGGGAHVALGFPAARFYHGTTAVPAWKLVKADPDIENSDRKIVFESPLKSTDDIFELSYYTARDECRRCQGLGIEFDIRYDTYGDPIMTSGMDLLIQEVEKITLTVRGSNVFETWYGTTIGELVGQKVLNGQILEGQLVTEISQTLERYKEVKIQQSKLQPMTPEELILDVRNIEVEQDDIDPTVFRVRIEVRNRANQVDQLQKTLVVNAYDNFERVL